MTDGDMHVENNHQKTQKRKKNDDKMQCDAVMPGPFMGQPQPGA